MSPKQQRAGPLRPTPSKNASAPVYRAEPALANEPGYEPFPVDVLPESLRGYVTAGAAAMRCDPAYIALPLLPMLASAIGTSRELRLKRSWYAPAILWGAIVGESGTLKTPAMRMAMRPLYELQRAAHREHPARMTEYEAALAAWQQQPEDERGAEPKPPVVPRYYVSDTTVEALAPLLLDHPRGLLLARDELAGWLGSMDRYARARGGDSAHWLSMYHGEPMSVDRRTGVPRHIYVPAAAVSIVGGIQPGILRRALGDEHRESGLAARLLLAYPPRRPKKWTDADIDEQLEQRMAQMVSRLHELRPDSDEHGEPRPRTVSLTPEARAQWTAYYNAHAVEQAQHVGDMAAALAKLEDAAARLALVLHLVRWAAGDEPDPDHLGEISMVAGIALTKWFRGEAHRVYAMLDESDEDRNQRRLVEWLGARGRPVTARDVQQGCRWLSGPGEAEAALAALAKAGAGHWQPIAPTARGGRPARVFSLSTASTVYGTPVFPGEKTGSVDIDSVGAVQSVDGDGEWGYV